MSAVTVPSPAATPPPPSRSGPLRSAFAPIAEVYRRDRFARIGFIIYAIMFVIAIFAPLIAQHDPTEVISIGG